MKNTQKKHTIISDIFFLLQFIWTLEKKLYALNAVTILLSSVNPLVSVVFLKFIMDEILNGKRVWMLISLISGMCLLLWSISAILAILAPIFEQKKTILQSRLIQKIGDCAQRMPYAELEKPWTKNLLELSKDTNNFLNVIESLVSTLSSFVSLISLASIIAIIEPMFFLPLGAVVVTQLVLNLISQKMMNEDWKAHVIGALRKGRYTSSLLDNPIYGEEIRVNAMQRWLFLRADKSFEEYVTHAYRTSKKASLFAIIQILLMAGIFVYLLFYLADVIIDGTLDASNAVMALSAVISVASVGQTFGNSVSEVMRSAIFVKDFRKCVALSEVTKEGHAVGERFPLDMSGVKIEFKNVDFCYPGTDKFILKDFSMTISPNEKVALVGINGAGKTTLVKLLCRFYEPTHGGIYMNNVDIRKISFASYYQNISAVFQDFKMFAFSMKENIILDEEKTNIEKLYNALDKSGISEKVKQLSKGLDTMYSREFDEHGEEFSGGEGQKLAIARAFYKNSPIIMLDEPTASLDALAEFELYRSFHKLVENKTAIFISHRLASTRFCDKICVLQQGNIVEEGTHEELMLNPQGLYFRMFSAQAAHYLEA